jgi:hypothetical protein
MHFPYLDAWDAQVEVECKASLCKGGTVDAAALDVDILVWEVLHNRC